MRSHRACCARLRFSAHWLFGYAILKPVSSVERYFVIKFKSTCVHIFMCFYLRAHTHTHTMPHIDKSELQLETHKPFGFLCHFFLCWHCQCCCCCCHTKFIVFRFFGLLLTFPLFFASLFVLFFLPAHSLFLSLHFETKRCNTTIRWRVNSLWQTPAANRKGEIMEIAKANKDINAMWRAKFQ